MLIINQDHDKIIPTKKQRHCSRYPQSIKARYTALTFIMATHTSATYAATTYSVHLTVHYKPSEKCKKSKYAQRVSIMSVATVQTNQNPS
jgi:hypothetical protein